MQPGSKLWTLLYFSCLIFSAILQNLENYEKLYYSQSLDMNRYLDNKSTGLTCSSSSRSGCSSAGAVPWPPGPGSASVLHAACPCHGRGQTCHVSRVTRPCNKHGCNHVSHIAPSIFDSLDRSSSAAAVAKIYLCVVLLVVVSTNANARDLVILTLGIIN